MFDLTGRTALVTGAGQGIGFAIAQGLADAGAHLVLNGRSSDKIEDAAARLRASGATAQTAAFDVADARQVRDAVDRLEKEGTAIDILVNNAGIQRRCPLQDYGHADWAEVMRTNLDGVFYVAQAVAQHMITRRRGKIINIGSVLSEVARPTVGAYAAAKGAVKNLTRAMCADWGPLGIQANAIGPGYIETAINDTLLADATFDAWLRNRTPAGRLGKPEELHGAAVFLASAASDFVNGQMLYVDGGMLAVL